MEFTIYDLSDVIDDENDNFIFEDHKDELSEIEMGLSSGELRQSILDRFRSAVRNKDIPFINVNFEKHDLLLQEDSLDSELEEDAVIEDIDKILYDLEDEEITDTMWVLPNEVIYVKGEEW